jgi:hypothetical protein
LKVTATSEKIKIRKNREGSNKMSSSSSSSAATTRIKGKAATTPAGLASEAPVATADHGRDQRVLRKRLNEVYHRAVDGTVASVQTTDFDVGNIKGRNKLQNILINKLARIEDDFKVMFGTMCR